MTLTQLKAPAKPAMWAPCNGCGVCCAAEPCRVAREVLDAPTGRACPVMEFVDGQFRCGFASRLDGFMLSAFASLMGFGGGCDSTAPEGSVVCRDGDELVPSYPAPSEAP